MVKLGTGAVIVQECAVKAELWCFVDGGVGGVYSLYLKWMIISSV